MGIVIIPIVVSGKQGMKVSRTLNGKHRLLNPFRITITT